MDTVHVEFFDEKPTALKKGKILQKRKRFFKKTRDN